MDAFFRFFEKFAKPFDGVIDTRPPPAGLGFIRHYARQVRGGFAAMLILGGITALIEATLFIMVGFIVDLMNDTPRELFWQGNLSILILIALFVTVLRSIIATATAVVEEQIIVPDFFTRVRWQAHKTVARQDVSFFDDNLAGKVSNKIWQAGNAAGDFMVSLFQIIWFIVVFALTTLFVIASLDWRMMLPVLAWLMIVGLIAWIFVPRIRNHGRLLAESTSVVTGRMVDGYSNIRTVKLYGAEGSQDEFIADAYVDVMAELRRFTRVAIRIAVQASALAVKINAIKRSPRHISA